MDGGAAYSARLGEGQVGRTTRSVLDLSEEGSPASTYSHVGDGRSYKPPAGGGADWGVKVTNISVVLSAPNVPPR